MLIDDKTLTIRHYKPLLNLRRRLTPEAKRQLQEAFAKYYKSTFESALGD